MLGFGISANTLLFESRPLRNRLSETMPSFLVQRVDFRPRWREKHAFVVSRIDQAEALDEPLSGQALKRGRSIDQASVEKDPVRGGISSGPVGEGYLYDTPEKTDRILPGQRVAAALQFFGIDPPTWFFDGGKTASSKLCQQGRFATAGTT
jgi:hypothetical protein